MYLYMDETRDIQSNITLCPKEFPRAKPEWRKKIFKKSKILISLNFWLIFRLFVSDVCIFQNSPFPNFQPMSAFAFSPSPFFSQCLHFSFNIHIKSQTDCHSCPPTIPLQLPTPSESSRTVSPCPSVSWIRHKSDWLFLKDSNLTSVCHRDVERLVERIISNV